MSFLQKITLILILALTLSLNIGIASMHTDDMGNMTDCPFTGVVAVCQMGPFEHIKVVQSVFSGMPIKSFVLAIFSLVLIIHLTITPKINSPPNTFRFYIKRFSHFPSPNSVLLALSDGRIQPKLYA